MSDDFIIHNSSFLISRRYRQLALSRTPALPLTTPPALIPGMSTCCGHSCLQFLLSPLIIWVPAAMQPCSYATCSHATNISSCAEQCYIYRLSPERCSWIVLVIEGILQRV